MERRRLLRSFAAFAAYTAVRSAPLAAATERAHKGSLTPNSAAEYGQLTLPSGIRSRRVANNGITQHVLEAGFESPGRPCVLLLHGFPELAYSWRHQFLPLAAVGFHVLAPDLRGYGLSAPTPVAFDDDLTAYSPMNRVVDVLGLARAFGHEKVASIIGHDWGAPIAQWCALARPDVFQSVVSMSNPFYGSPQLPLNTASKPPRARASIDIDRDLAALSRPRKRYTRYYATREANEDMWHPPQGVHDLLRAWYHFKSADWKDNKPVALTSWTAAELARMPTYYVMDLKKGVAETMAEQMPTREQIAACRWMTEQDLAVYAEQYTRTGFQGGLNSYRFLETGWDELRVLSGKTIDVPACFIGGASDWGVRQLPGAFEEMSKACKNLMGVHLVEGAGHSLAEEQPEKINQLLLAFLKAAGLSSRA